MIAKRYAICANQLLSVLCHIVHTGYKHIQNGTYVLRGEIGRKKEVAVTTKGYFDCPISFMVIIGEALLIIYLNTHRKFEITRRMF